MTEDPIHVFLNELGNYGWLQEDREAVTQALAGICDSLAGESDEVIHQAIMEYLSKLHKESKGKLN
jgi:hypothetical protein